MRLQDLLQVRDSSGKLRCEKLEQWGVFLLIIYVIAGLIYSALLAPVARFPDEQDYLKLSASLVHGPGFSIDGINLTASRAPGYAFFLATIQSMGGGYFGFRAIQFLLLGATIMLVSRLCSDKKSFAGLLISTGLVVCYPVLFYTSTTLYPQTVAGFLFVLALILLKANSKSLVSNLAAGFIFGALILVVPTFLFTMAIVMVSAVRYKITGWRNVVLMTLAAAVTVGSWTSRNAIYFHRFVPVATNSGLNFLEGNNAQANAFEAAANVGMEPYYQQADQLGLDEFQRDQFYREAAMNWIKAHPGRASLLYFEKVLNFFNILNGYSPQIEAEVSLWKQVVMAIGYLLLLGLLAWRLRDTRRFPLVPQEKLLLAIYVLSAFTSAIFFTRIRHRLPYDYLIISIIAWHLSRHLEIWVAAERPGEISIDNPMGPGASSMTKS